MGNIGYQFLMDHATNNYACSNVRDCLKSFSSVSLFLLCINFLVIFQHLGEALVPLSNEKEKLLQEHKDLKLKLEREYEEKSENKRSYQQDVEMLLLLASKIQEYVS